MLKSAFGSINFGDLLKGALLAGIVVLVAGIHTALSSGGFPTLQDLVGYLGAAGIAFVSYLVKNLFENSDGTPLKAEEVKPPTP